MLGNKEKTEPKIIGVVVVAVTVAVVVVMVVVVVVLVMGKHATPCSIDATRRNLNNKLDTAGRTIDDGEWYLLLALLSHRDIALVDI